MTEKAGVGAEGLFGMGVAVGDYDNDGFPDLMALGYDRSILYHNNRNGTFSDVTARAGVSNKGKWASSAAWFDYDRDGRLDLAIANYVAGRRITTSGAVIKNPVIAATAIRISFAVRSRRFIATTATATFTDVTETSKVGLTRAAAWASLLSTSTMMDGRTS